MNRNHQQLAASLSLVLAMAACSSSDSSSDHESAAASAPLTVAGFTAFPCDPATKENTWNGTKIQLMLADAMASCQDQSDGFFPSSTRYDPAYMSDAALSAVIGHMQEVGAENVAVWRYVRQIDGDIFPDPTGVGAPFLNCSPLDGEFTVGLIEDSQVVEKLNALNNSAYNHEQVKRADVDLRWPAYNYCIAQRLREQAPGAMGGEAIFLSQAEQRELLETIRERAQIAMINYATLGVIFGSPGEGGILAFLSLLYAGSVNPGSLDLRILLLKDWALESSASYGGINGDLPEVRQEQLNAMGRDFAAAVQLHITVTQELAELFARSRSAREPHTGLDDEIPLAEQTRADELWGFGSWQQRQAALLYGGDPLAIGEGGPWTHPFGVTAPSFSRISFPTEKYAWPSRLQSPYVTTALNEPQVDELLSLARRFDQLRFDLTSTGGYTQCESIVVDSSAAKLFDAVEVALGNSMCAGGTVPGGTDCVPWTVPSDDGDTLLWTRHRITRKHAATLSAFIHDVLGPKFGIPTPSQDIFQCASRYGALSLAGVMSYENGNPSRLHIQADADFVARGLPDLAPTFTRNADFRIPQAASINIGVIAQDQGLSNADATTFLPRGINEESKRRMGSISALTATREAILDTLAALNANTGEVHNRLNDYFKHADKIVGVIDAAVGDSGVAVRPQVINSGTSKVLERGAGNRPMWNVTVTTKAGDAFWTSADATLELFAIKNGWVSEFVQNFPKTRAFAGTSPQLGSLLLTARAAGRSAFPTPIAGSPRRWSASGILLDNFAYSPQFLGEGDTILVWRATDAERDALVAPGSPEVKGAFQLLGADFILDPHRNHGQYVATGGALGNWIGRQLTPLLQNPAVVSTDGFGLPTDWVPPFSAELLGGSPGESSVEHLLAAAKQSADDATQAVETAMQNLLRELDLEFEQQRDEAELAAETAKSQAGIAEEAQALCGAGQTTCDSSVALRKLDSAWYPALTELPVPVDDNGAPIVCDLLNAPPNPELPPPPPTDPVTFVGCAATPLAFENAPKAKTESNKAGRNVDCFIKKRIDDFMSPNYVIANRVVAAIEDEPGVPSFQDYAGGALQSSFVEQWRAITTVDEQFDVMIKSAKAAKSSMEVANQALASANAHVQRACGSCAMANAIKAGFTFGILPSWSPGPLHAQKQECAQARDDQKVALTQALAARDNSMLAVSSASVGLTDKQAAITQGAVSVQGLEGITELAKKRHELEIALIEALPTQKASFGLFRRYRNYDIWRAKALLDNARRYAVAARRAIEARYIVNLSDLTQPEPFVASPATWADEIYEYDLSLPAAVGLTVAPPAGSNSSAESPGIYSNKVKDYVANLEAFVNGFAVYRPTAIAHDEIDVVTIPGIAVSPATDLDGVLIHPEPNAWTVRCPGAAPNSEGAWVPIPAPEDGGVLTACFDSSVVPPACDCVAGDVACQVQCVCQCPINETECVADCGLTRPIAARLTFTLDPWGRFNDGVLNEPFAKRYNARWDRLAVNFVGTGIRDCEKASDPLGCYGEGFLRYDLSHLGRVWVTEYSGTWRPLGVPIGRIEGAKALAAELWLNPLNDGWTTPYISAVARTEFVMRPLGGMYEMQFQAGPDVRLDRIERVQLLVGSQSWVQQQ